MFLPKNHVKMGIKLMKNIWMTILVMLLCIVIFAGCNAQASDETGEILNDAETTTEGVEGATNETSEVTSEEMTLEEKILAEMPAKLEVGEDEIIVPETVTAEQIMARWEEIKVSDVEYADDINKENLAGLLVLNCSYMEPDEFNALVNEHFGSVDELLFNFSNYNNYLLDSNNLYGYGSSVLPEKLFFDKYLINQAEQLHYFFDLYQNDDENSKFYYDILVDYVYRDNNQYLTFDCDDERLEGSGLASLQSIVAGVIVDDLIVYDTDLYTAGVGAETINNTEDIVEEQYNK